MSAIFNAIQHESAIPDLISGGWWSVLIVVLLFLGAYASVTGEKKNWPPEN